MTICFEIKGEPAAKGRPRMTKSGHAYTPAKTRNYEDYVRWSYIQQVRNTDMITDKPVGVSMVFRFAVPKSYGKKTLEELKKHKMARPVKPDIDNLAKSVLDALNGLAYQDDKLITHLEVSKIYSENPGTTVCIYEI